MSRLGTHRFRTRLADAASGRQLLFTGNPADMPVPPISRLRPGVAVNIVLKADQPTGKLTQGRIMDLLTRGDHPRGVKVRLEDGKIGRVQSLASSSSGPSIPTSIQSNTPPTSTLPSISTPGSFSHRSRRRYGDIRQDENAPLPPEERSLQDYVTFKTTKPKKGRGGRKGPQSLEGSESGEPGMLDQQQQSIIADENGAVEQDVQTTLCKEFPQLDSSLIAAIVSDMGTLEQSRQVLGRIAALDT